MAMIVGLDLGTTSMAGVLFDTDGKRVVGSAAAPNEAAVALRGPYEHARDEQSPAAIVHQAAGLIRQLGETANRHGRSVEAIGVTGQMHGMMVIDRQRQPLSNVITWQDGRADDLTSARGISYVREMIDRVPPEAWERVGCLPATGYLGATLYWMKRNALVPPGAFRVAFVQDWVVAELADATVVTDPSDAASAGIFDLTTKSWSRTIIEALELPGELLPEIRESGAVVGSLSPRWGSELGLPAGIPVCNALGDNQASFLGSVANPANSLLVNIGTGGQISWVVNQFVRHEQTDTRYLPIDRYLIVGASLCGGKAYSWLADFYSRVIAMVTKPPPKDDIYELMNRLATRASPDTRGLRVEPTIMGTRAEPAKRGSIVGIDQENFEPANLTRAVLEGMVDELWQLYQAAPAESRAPHTRIVASGNGVRRNPLLARIIARRCDLPVYVPRHTEEASVGAALAAGVGIGAFSSFDEACRCIHYLGAIA